MNDWVKIRLTRDSVAAGDDVDAPHEKTFQLHPAERIASLVAKIRENRFLPTIHGGKATWFLYIDAEPICLMTEENERTLFVPGKDYRIEER